MSNDKKPVKRTAAKKDPQKELQKAIDKARKAGLSVRAYSTNLDDDGVSTGREH